MTKRTLSILLAISALAFSMLACSLVGDTADKAGIETESEEVMEESSSNMENESMDIEEEETTEMESEDSSPQQSDSSSLEADFAVPPSAKVMQSSPEMLMGTTKSSIDEVISFYREETTKQGLKEDTLLTSITDSTFSLVFRGSANGKMYILQGTTIADDSVAFSVRYE